MLSSRRLIHIVLVVAVAGLGFAAYVAVGPPAAAKAPTTTATVQRGVVLSSVSATGNVSPSTQLALDFQNSGIVSEIDVSVGQQVKAGQVLAKVQNQSAQDTFNVAKMNLASAQTKLAEALHPTGATAAQQEASLTTSNVAVTSAQNSLASAQQTQTIDATSQTALVAAAQTKLTNDTANASALVDADNAQLTADTAQLSADESPGSSYQQKITTDINNQSGACGNNATLCSNDSGTLAADQATLAEKLAGDQTKIVADQQKVQTDGQLLTTDQTALTNAQNTQSAATMKDQQAITAAQNQLASAQASLASTRAGLVTDPATLTGDEASAASAQQQFDTAQQALTNTTLTSPVAGTVGAVNGAVGEAATGSLSGSSSSSTSSSSTGSAGASSGGFISLTDLSTLQVVAGFSETDASKVTVGEPATVTFNALTGVDLQGKVTQVQINSITVSNVITYNVIVSIVGAPPTLKPGMTANVSVTTAEKDNVLELPSSAITATGNTAVVDVLQPNGSTIAKTITIGMRGDTNDEITSGVNVGDKIVVSLASRAGSLSTARTGAAGLGGLGGGGLGGGGAVVRVGGG